MLHMFTTCPNVSFTVIDMQTMARPQSENTFQVAFKIPPEWLKMADEIAAAMSRPGVKITRTDALRAALADGLHKLHAEHVPVRRPMSSSATRRHHDPSMTPTKRTK